MPTDLLERGKALLPEPIKTIIRLVRDFFQWDRYFVKSWSQEGEDLILFRFFGLKKNGFYVDVGAHHPIRFSNTYRFYRRGWNGINIDATPGSMNAFSRLRVRDINLELPISSGRRQLTYYMYSEPALNGFTEGLRSKDKSCRLVATMILQTEPLSDVFQKYVPKDKEIDFLNVDVEGHDLEVLRSNDWDRYRPKMVLAESLTSSLESICQGELSRFMSEQGYTIYAKTVNTVFFLRK